MIWVTSDLHFNHLNILKYEAKTRPFNSIEEMNSILINNWNSVVQDDDIVYILGDFFLGNKKDVLPILEQLKGNKILIRGNHDDNTRIKIYKNNNIEVKDIDYIKYKGKFFILLHFPLFNNEFFNMVTNNNPECILLYGHTHGNSPSGYYNNTYHVGVDTNNLTPITLEQIWKESQV